MSDESNKILKYLNKHSSKDNPIEFFKLMETLDIEKEIFESEINYLLNEHKIIKSQKIIVGTEITYTESYYYSSKRGKNFFKNITKNQIKTFLIFVICNILVPILVAYITSILTCNQCSNNTNQYNKQNMTNNS